MFYSTFLLLVFSLPFACFAQLQTREQVTVAVAELLSLSLPLSQQISINPSTSITFLFRSCPFPLQLVFLPQKFPSVPSSHGCALGAESIFKLEEPFVAVNFLDHSVRILYIIFNSIFYFYVRNLNSCEKNKIKIVLNLILIR